MNKLERSDQRQMTSEPLHLSENGSSNIQDDVQRHDNGDAKSIRRLDRCWGGESSQL